jgi:hypothetical protein
MYAQVQRRLVGLSQNRSNRDRVNMRTRPTSSKKINKWVVSGKQISRTSDYPRKWTQQQSIRKLHHKRGLLHFPEDRARVASTAFTRQKKRLCVPLLRMCCLLTRPFNFNLTSTLKRGTIRPPKTSMPTYLSLFMRGHIDRNTIFPRVPRNPRSQVSLLEPLSTQLRVAFGLQC